MKVYRPGVVEYIDEPNTAPVQAPKTPPLPSIQQAMAAAQARQKLADTAAASQPIANGPHAINTKPEVK